ncbi:FtsX-like permease family protein [Pelomonas sp. SE-A7]|uniref:ABC transporter permease n=1 Tax=Pelomonas sp. SE-A7 TaxID=3054953 RepID=UPI00259D11CD|nr:FtsX-like permease family protein [Pelomonas sp. SE-A7]MDM4768033.1 ABC transporter permease [Pelomonas sp. SE-A7]
MDLMPILATLKRHKTAAGLIVLQVALTCAIVCNALFLISQRVERISEPSGMADDELVLVSTTGVAPSQNPEAQTKVDIAALRGVPGVSGVAVMNQIPFGKQYSQSGLRRTEDENTEGVGVARYSASEDTVKVLGLRLVEGRDFDAGEYVDAATFGETQDARLPGILINQALAKRMFPGESPLGKKLWGVAGGNGGTPVIGVVEKFVSPQPGQGANSDSEYTMLMPVRESFRSGGYVLRVDPARRDQILKEAVAALDRAGPGRILRENQSLADMRAKYYAEDRNMVGLLVGVCVALLLVTAFGIVGLASFWVQQRTRMIGTRRALGATAGQIRRYFQTENFLLTSAGLILGMGAAYGISLLLMKNYELPRLPLMYLPVGCLALWLLGQLAVLSPARRAAALPPVAALRS